MKKCELIKKGITLMNDKIQAGVESSLNRIVQQVIAYSNALEESKTLLDKTQQLFYDSLAQTYSITSNELKQIYSRTKDFEVSDILSFTYNKTLNERIAEHWHKAASYTDKQAMRIYLIDKYDRLLRNETQIIKNTVMQNKVGKLSQLVIIENSGGGTVMVDAHSTQANGQQMKQFFHLITLIVVVKRIMIIRTMKMI